MQLETPTVGEYNQLIGQQGGAAFHRLNELFFVPARTSPFKVYLFGSGAFAAVFKGSLGGSYLAVRCFLAPDDAVVTRYRAICSYLNTIKADWKVNCKLFENEFSFKGRLYPVLTMDWVEGKLIQDFVTEHLHDNSVLTELQGQLVKVSSELEFHGVGHGDIQCGNIMVVRKAGEIRIKLIDYDGMYVPGLNSVPLERGRSEFQHPERAISHYGPRVDRFSFWVILTALEALKHDKSLWNFVTEGGLNTQDNFLFTGRDFLDPSVSEAFSRIEKIQAPVLMKYIRQLRANCEGNVQDIPPLSIFQSDGEICQPQSVRFTDPPAPQILIPPAHTYPAKKEVQRNPANFFISSETSPVYIFSSLFKKLGDAPLELDFGQFDGKTILVSDGKVTKRVLLTGDRRDVRVEFG